MPHKGYSTGSHRTEKCSTKKNNDTKYGQELLAHRDTQDWFQYTLFLDKDTHTHTHTHTQCRNEVHNGLQNKMRLPAIQDY